MTKLTDLQKINLMKDYKSGNFTYLTLGKKYSITKSSVYSLIKRRNNLNQNRQNNKLTDQDKINIIKLYKTGKYTIDTLSKNFGIAVTNIYRLLNTRKVKKVVCKVPRKSKQNINRKYNLNQYYFDKIDTEDKAYFLGLLYSDGNNFVKTSRISIGLQETDRDILDKFIKYLEYEAGLKYKKNKKCKNSYIVDIHSKIMSQSLIKLGCVARKSLILKFPTFKQVPKILMRHFLRGMWDGDGCIRIYLAERKYKTGQTILASSIQFCKGLQSYLTKELETNFSLKIIKKKYGALAINGNQKTLFFLNWLYKDATIYLERKYQKYQELIDICKNVNKSHSYSKFNKINSIN